MWILALIFIPFLGFILYLLFGQHYFKEKKFALKARSDRAVLDEFIAEQQSALDQARATRTEKEARSIIQIMDLLLTDNDAVITEKNEVRSFVRGKDKFDALLEAIRGAKHHIHLEYYIIKNDELGREVVAALTEKARQGVEVRLLYDALGNKIPPEGYKDLIAAGGKVSAVLQGAHSGRHPAGELS